MEDNEKQNCTVFPALYPVHVVVTEHTFLPFKRKLIYMVIYPISLTQLHISLRNIIHGQNKDFSVKYFKLYFYVTISIKTYFELYFYVTAYLILK